MRNSTRLWLALQLALGTAVAGAAWGQTAVFTPAAPATGNVMFRFGPSRCGIDALALQGTTDGRDKLNAPYSGLGITEVVTTLADGNRITRKNTMRYFRDSRGRTRTEFELATLGPVALDTKRSMITINDPEAKAHYMLHPEDKLATEFKNDGAVRGLIASGSGASNVMMARRLTDAGVTPPPPPPSAAGERVMLLRERVAEPLEKACAGQPKPTPVALGERTIEGLRTTGSKLETVIPAGEIGNELPITIATEQWFSPELGVVIASTHQDPMVGITTYRLTQISRSEPDAKLFTVPADYKRSQPAIRSFDLKVPGPDKNAGRPAEQ